MKTIYKYKVYPTDEFELSLPKGAYILCVQMQDSEPYIWTMVDTEAPLEIRKFILRGTGHTLPELPLVYIGTFQMRDGLLVFHLFERVEATI